MISIIIPTFNEEGFIEETLKHLASFTLPHEIIVSDGGSPDKTASLARQYADTVVESKEANTISKGKNKGAEVAEGDYFVFVDADLRIPHPDAFFTSLLQRFAEDRALMGVVVPIWVEAEQATLADRIMFTLLNFTYWLLNNVFHIGNGSGEFQMMRASAFRTLQGYREDLPAGEDNDMFARLSQIGKTRFCRDLAVFHSGRRAHKKGWPNVLFSWVKNGIWVMLFNKSAYKDWEKVR